VALLSWRPINFDRWLYLAEATCGTARVQASCAPAHLYHRPRPRPAGRFSDRGSGGRRARRVIAAEVRLSARYAAVTLVLAGFLAASALAGRFLGAAASRPAAVALLLTISMRDFAIAAGLTTAAFGPAAAPLGLYGILVLAWGTAAAGVLRQRQNDGPSRRLTFTRPADAQPSASAHVAVVSVLVSFTSRLPRDHWGRFDGTDFV
jgi:MFS family permease